MPLHAVRNNFNFSTDQRRVLNFEHIVSESDNIKQDMSIDVYGRTEKEEAQPAKVCLAATRQGPRIRGLSQRSAGCNRAHSSCRLCMVGL